MRKGYLAVLAAAALVPFGFNGASAELAPVVADEQGVDTLVDENMVEVFGAPAASVETNKGSTAQGGACCYVFLFGRWFCIPC
jgi:hypothetical protein